MDTFVESSLSNQKLIAFNAGTHTDLIAMEFDDYCRLARPIFAHIDMDPITLGGHVEQL